MKFRAKRKDNGETEIKLPRVWDKVDKKMLSPAKWEEDFVGDGHKKIGLYIYRSKKDPRQHSSLDWVLKHPEFFEVMWSTGLKDKNGKEGYYKDISQDEDEDRYVIEWDEDLGYNYLKGIGENCLGTQTEDLAISALKNQEIIGNRHDNPELLCK